MAKKKKRTTRSRKPAKKQVPEHTLPSGFWAQVSAVVLLALSVLLIVSWFGAGGPIFTWIMHALDQLIGKALYVLPILFVYLAVQIFRAEDNRLPASVYVASVLLICWLAGLSGLFFVAAATGTTNILGGMVNGGMLALVNKPVAVFIYVLLAIITVVFVLSIAPKDALMAFVNLFRGAEAGDEEANVKVMRRAQEADGKQSIGELKLNAGVPTLTPEERRLDEKKAAKLSSLKGSSTRDSAAEDGAALVAVNDPNWQAPSLDLLEKKQNPADAGDVQQNAQIIHDTLSEFNIDVEMEGANIGPKVTQYTLKPPSGVKLTRITALETNIALSLAAKALRIEAPIPGKSAVGIEVPNKRAADVRLHGILESKEWTSNHEPLSFAIGRDISGSAIVGELNKMPHLLIAGQTNSGKSVMINTLLCSLLYRNSPSQMKVILVDPKQVEMARYQDIPHLLTPIITQPEPTVSALKWAVNEMERRYKLLAEVGELNIKDYNDSLRSARKKKVAVTDEADHEQQPEDGSMPYIVIVIDEMADLMMTAGRDVEALIVRLAQKARAVGIHLVVATQSPRADVITGLIKANIPAKIAFTVSNQVESRIILDNVGAEKLLGQGDMLYKTATMNKPARIQGALVENKEVKKIADHLRQQSPPQYNDEVVSQPVQLNGKGGVVMDFDNQGGDSVYNDAVRLVVESRKASTSMLQMRLRVGYARAARIIAEMEEQGIIGAADGSRPREVLISSLSDLDGSDEI